MCWVFWEACELPKYRQKKILSVNTLDALTNLQPILEIISLSIVPSAYFFFIIIFSCKSEENSTGEHWKMPVL